MDKHKIFVSHGETDLNIAMQIVEFLEEYGHQCWVDPRDVKDIDNWAEEVDAAISECDSFVVICGAGAGRSVRIPKEVGLASSEGKKIIQYRLEETELSGALRYHLIDSIVIHAIEDTNAKLDYLIEAVTQVSGEVEGLKDGKEKKAKGQERNWKKIGKSLIDRLKSRFEYGVDKVKNHREMLKVFAGTLVLVIGVLIVAFIVIKEVEKRFSYDYMMVYFYRNAQETEITRIEGQGMQDALQERWNKYYGKKRYRLKETDQVLMAKVPSDKVVSKSINEVLEQIAGENYDFYRTVPTVWKSAKEDPFRGVYQCDVKELQGQLYDAVYDCYESKYEDGNVSDGNWHDVNRQLRSRLDVLEIPYAIGCLSDRERTIVVRIDMRTINSAVLGLLTNDPIIRITPESGRIYDGKLSGVQYGERENGTLWVKAWLSNGTEELVKESGSCKVYIQDDVSVCALSGTQNGKEIVFDSSPYAEDGSIPVQAEPLIRMIQKACEDGSCAGYYYDVGNSAGVVWSKEAFQNLREGRFRFGLRYLKHEGEAEELCKRLSNVIGPDITVKIEKDRYCHIYDFLSLDEKFPEQVIEQTVAILEATKKDSFKKMSIHFTRESGEERARALWQNVKEEEIADMNATLEFVFRGENVEPYLKEVGKLADREAYFTENSIVPYEEYHEKQLEYLNTVFDFGD